MTGVPEVLYATSDDEREARALAAEAYACGGRARVLSVQEMAQRNHPLTPHTADRWAVLADRHRPLPSYDVTELASAEEDKKAAEAERDSANEQVHWLTQAESRLEAENARLREALMEIRDAKPVWSQQGKHWVPFAYRLQSIAARALSASERASSWDVWEDGAWTPKAPPRAAS